jgi:predicted metal-binding membrane protein
MADGTLMRVRRLAWYHPEWPWLLAAAAAWATLVIVPAFRNDHASSHAQVGLTTTWLGAWLLVVIAMMVPATTPMLREASLQSLWSRRYGNAGMILVGFLTVWLAFGVVSVKTVGATPLSHGSRPLLAGALLLLAALWCLSPVKLRHLRRCHRYRPLPVRGARADLAALRLGLAQGRDCIGVCWPAMATMIVSHALVVMVVVFLVSSWERLAERPHVGQGALALAGVALLQVIVFQ